MKEHYLSEHERFVKIFREQLDNLGDAEAYQKATRIVGHLLEIEARLKEMGEDMGDNGVAQYYPEFNELKKSVH